MLTCTRLLRMGSLALLLSASSASGETTTPAVPAPAAPAAVAPAAAAPAAAAPAAVAPPSAPAEQATPSEKKAGEKKAGEDKAGAETSSREPLRWRAPSVRGPIGIDTLLSADTGAVQTIRLRLTGFFSDADDWPVSGSSNAFSGTRFAASYTPHEHVEVFASIRNTSNVNRGTSPVVLQTQGDTSLGVKGGYRLADVFTAGMALAIHLVSDVGEGGIAGDSTSAELTALGTLDLQRAEGIPLRIHFNVGYFMENSENLQPEALDVIQEWGLQSYRYDRITTGLGFEVPAHEYVAPYLEYRLDVPLQVELPRQERFSDEFAFNTFPHHITAGLRGFPVPELALEAAVRVGLSSNQYTGVPATPPWLLVLGASYTLDPRPEVITKEIVKEVPVEPATPPAPPRGTATGRVLDAKTGVPIEGALIDYPGTARTAQRVAADGVYTSYELPPGKVKLRATSPMYTPAEVEVTIEAGKTAPLDLQLALDPTKAHGNLKLTVLDNKGTPVIAQVEIGAAEGSEGEGLSLETDPAGRLTVKLKPGKYPITVSAPKTKAPVGRDVEIVGGQDAPLRIVLEKGRAHRSGGASRGLAYRKGKRIRLRRKISFSGKTAKLTGRAKAVLRAVAGVIKKDRIKKVRVGVHTDSKGNKRKLKRLTAKQGAAVKRYLIARGVKASVLTVKGYGSGKPVAPNLSKRGREKNQRVEFTILKR